MAGEGSKRGKKRKKAKAVLGLGYVCVKIQDLEEFEKEKMI